MKQTLNSPRCTGGLLGLGILIGGVLLALPQTSTAQTCLKDEYGKNVQCTANDVRIAKATNVRDPNTGAAITSCIANSTFSFVADFQVVTTATARENIGMYFATGGQASALTGTCADNIISPVHPDPNVNQQQFPNAPQLGTSQYESLDAAPDNCGDISTSDNNQVVTVYVQNALCKAGANGQVALPNCTSWQQPGGTIQCVSAAPGYPWVAAAIPGSPSKCNCDNTFTIPVTVQMPGVGVTKTCTISQQQQNLSLCQFSGEGGTVTYTLTITNTSNFGSVVIDQVCDSFYGGLFTAAGFNGNHCSPAANISSNTCSGLTSVGNTAVSCTFQANVGENADVKDIITVYGHGDQGSAINPSSSGQVEVKSGEAPSTATISKTFGSNDQLCATVTYKVDVANTSGADENLSLTGLTDTTFGDVTKVQGSVLSTTCNVSAASPASLPVGGTDYKCSFQAQFCAQPSTIVATPGVCGGNGFCSAGLPGTTACTQNSDCNVTCTGIQHQNTINASMNGDEGTTDTGVTITPGGLTVSECVSVTSR